MNRDWTEEQIKNGCPSSVTKTDRSHSFLLVVSADQKWLERSEHL
jgi:hypothetical protein